MPTSVARCLHNEESADVDTDTRIRSGCHDVSLGELAALLASVDSTAIHERMGYKHPAGAVRRLDDALLAIFGEQYVGLHGNAHRVVLLRARLGKLTATA